MLADANLVVLYVDSPIDSARFYSELLELEPVDTSPTFVLFVLKQGLRLGLWSKHTVEPAAITAGGGGELCLQVAEDKLVDEVFSKWQQKNLCFEQTPTEMDFGYTFVALDPDNHRLRVFSLKV